jgi:hypothetical protein
MMDLVKTIAVLAALLTGSAAEGFAVEPSATVVEIENPFASSHPLQGYLRRTKGAGSSPAVGAKE